MAGDGRARAVALRLEQVLDRVHEALLAGRVTELADHGAGIEALLPGITGLDDLLLAQRLQAKSARNEACLAASARGVRAARRRFAEIMTAQQGLSTYDGQGRRQDVAEAAGKLSQRL
jgi:hypothetical protein